MLSVCLRRFHVWRDGSSGCAGVALSIAAAAWETRIYSIRQWPEFTAAQYKEWLKRVGIEPIHIYPGSPWENGYNERFNGTLRREVLNAVWFASIHQAQTVINLWLKQYNHIRPHHALGMRAPVPETLIEKSRISGPDIGG